MSGSLLAWNTGGFIAAGNGKAPGSVPSDWTVSAILPSSTEREEWLGCRTVSIVDGRIAAVLSSLTFLDDADDAKLVGGTVEGETDLEDEEDEPSSLVSDNGADDSPNPDVADDDVEERTTLGFAMFVVLLLSVAEVEVEAEVEGL